MYFVVNWFVNLYIVCANTLCNVCKEKSCFEGHFFSESGALVTLSGALVTF